MKTLITEDDFQLVENNEVDLYGIKILTGVFKHVIFTFGAVRLDENKEINEVKVKFDFKVEDPTYKYTIEELNESERFKNYISQILSIVLEKWLPEDNDKDTKTDTKENL